ncbi:MAG: dehydrogenase [Acidimicrobiaceae bacterium TMED130]|nr:MAG: dehydrogenase [Acidimicrobiaceae bacterium TMED130]|tara:strand:- start:17552 stop:18319 length:768 start_codon:yes stop_codon:yes gene_type:complete
MQDFKDFPGVALVVGGSGGIGSEICRLFAEKGSNVAFTYKSNVEKAEFLASEISDLGKLAVKESVDLNNPEEIDSFIESLHSAGGVHTLVFAAGPVVPQQHLSKISPSLFSQHLQLEVNAFFSSAIAALPQIRENQGTIIAVTSAATDRYPIKDGLSASPKAAIEVLVKGLAKEEGRYGVRANAVGPGMLTDGMASTLIERGDYSQNDLDIATANIPLGKYGQAIDVAEAVCFLASSKARYITGQILNVDGGYTA